MRSGDEIKSQNAIITFAKLSTDRLQQFVLQKHLLQAFQVLKQFKWITAMTRFWTFNCNRFEFWVTATRCKFFGFGDGVWESGFWSQNFGVGISESWMYDPNPSLGRAEGFQNFLLGLWFHNLSREWALWCLWESWKSSKALNSLVGSVVEPLTHRSFSE